MTIASFEELCAGFCEIVGASAPPLAADEQGRVVCHLTLSGASIKLVHCPQVSEAHVFVLFELGPVGDSRDELQALLDANFSSLQLHPPMFSRNPATGDAILQYVYPLAEATAHDLYELVESGAEWVGHWRDELAQAGWANREHIAPLMPTGMFHRIA